jgi:hypothetical protein
MQKTSLAMILVLGACTSSGEGTSTSELRGDAAFRDAKTDHAGNPQAPATPSDSVKITVVMNGTGQFSADKLDPRCALDPAGKFTATFTGSADTASGSAYLATLAAGKVTTASGCELPELSSLAILDAKVRAEITATTQSCKSYCEASARADAEAQCGATASAAQCRAQAESTAAASCQTTCTTQSEVIVAEASLATALFSGIDLNDLKTASFGDLEADLTFDHVE